MRLIHGTDLVRTKVGLSDIGLAARHTFRKSVPNTENILLTNLTRSE